MEEVNEEQGEDNFNEDEAMKEGSEHDKKEEEHEEE